MLALRAILRRSLASRAIDLQLSDLCDFTMTVVNRVRGALLLLCLLATAYIGTVAGRLGSCATFAGS